MNSIIRPKVLGVSGKEKGQLLGLAKHFFDRFFDLELVLPNAESRLGIAYVLPVLTVPGLLVSFWMMQKYSYLGLLGGRIPESETLADKCFFVALSMFIMGFISVLEWDLLFPDRKDFLILTPLPIRIRTMFTTKLAALLALLCLFTTAIKCFPTVLYPLVIMANKGSLLVFCRFIGSHAIAAFGGSTFVFFFSGSLQGLLMAGLNHRSFVRVSRFLQFFLLFALVVGLCMFPRIFSMFRSLWEQNNPLLTYFPPAWYLGVYEVLLGRHDPQFLVFARIGLWATALSMILFLLFFLLGYRRQVKMSLESGWEEAHLIKGGKNLVPQLVDRLFIRSPAQQAAFHFVVKTIMRSQRHRLVLSGYVGTGLALVVVGVIARAIQAGYRGFFEVNLAFLSAPLVVSFFALVGMRYIFTVPAELQANWIFKITEGQDCVGWFCGIRKVMSLTVIGPLFGLCLPIYSWLWGWKTASLHLLYGLILAILLMEILLLRFSKMPFTCSYLPGKANLKALWAPYAFGFMTYAYTLSELEFWLLQRPVRMITFYAVSSVLLWRIAAVRAGEERKAGRFIYAENPEPTVITLELSR
jgi:hypothetical protein